MLDQNEHSESSSSSHHSTSKRSLPPLAVNTVRPVVQVCTICQHPVPDHFDASHRWIGCRGALRNPHSPAVVQRDLSQLVQGPEELPPTPPAPRKTRTRKRHHRAPRSHYMAKFRPGDEHIQAVPSPRAQWVYYTIFRHPRSTRRELLSLLRESITPKFLDAALYDLRRADVLTTEEAQTDDTLPTEMHSTASQ